MSVSQKCQYALRALFELAKRDTEIPTAMSQIAEAQVIPPKFLELILSELRQGGFVESRRGRGGGYVLRDRPEELTVGMIIRFVDGPVAPVKCVAGDSPSDTMCVLYANCAFVDMWSRARDAVASVYDNTTFQDLVDRERMGAEAKANMYCI
ncbi:MAG: Rrf2 family transcriptional regulator [Phycisphaerae bacterium]|jgi:Rrf2 family protein|nr:Rrf2 family transcriptional regulator [Phycisphaerae bacterium]